jgi:hypothetical protein
VAPVIACDILTDPDPLGVGGAVQRSAVNVAFLDVGDLGGDRILELRSVDSGVTFSASGARADGPAGEVLGDTPAPCDAGDEVCLYRSDVTPRDPHTPPRPQVYRAPPTVEGISLQGVPQQCPLAAGDAEKDPSARRNGVPLVLYQVNRPVTTLRVRTDGSGLRFDF